MRIKGNPLLLLLPLIAVAWLTVLRTLPPMPLPGDAPAAEFSARRAMSHIRAIATAPHPAGSAGNRMVREYILGQLHLLGMETETQAGEHLENVVARIAGTASSGAVLLTAHLDSVPESPGATDDGSGVAVLLETARALRSAPPPANTVIFLFTDGEEGGLRGAKLFIARHPWAKDVRVVIGFDAGGLTGPGVLSSCSRGNGWLIGQLARADPHLLGSSAITALADSGTDFGHAFKPAGFSGCAFDLYWDRRIHTPADNIANVSLSSLQHQGFHALSAARRFGSLDPLADPRGPDAVYFTVLQLYAVMYSPAWACVLAIVGAALFIALAASGLRRRVLTWRGLGRGALVWLAGLLVVPIPGILLGRWGAGVPLRYYGRLLDGPFQVTAVALSALVLAILWYTLAGRLTRASSLDLMLGALAPVAAGMLASAFVFPALSFLFTWPLLFGLPACATWLYWRGPPRSSIAAATAISSSAASMIILGPTIILALFDQTPLALALLGVLCGLLVPQVGLALLPPALPRQPSTG